MKKIRFLIVALLLAGSLFAACGGTSSSSSSDSSQEEGSSSQESGQTSSEDKQSSESAAAEAANIRIGALKGPTAMGMVSMMQEAEDGNYGDDNYEFAIAGAIDEVVTKVVQGELDIAAIPANLSSVVYNNTKGQVQVLAINTLGVLYIVENGNTVNTIEDLEGKTIYSSGKGASPEFALNYILEKSGMAGKVNVEWKSEHTECVAAIAADPSAIALLPQPFVTTAQGKNPDLRVALNLTEEWDKVEAGEENPSAMITGVVIVRSEFAQANPEAVSTFMDRYAASVDYVNSNNDEAAKLVAKYDIVPEAVAVKALPECSITFIEGSDMKTKLRGYLEVLFMQNPKSVGENLPGDDFYYSR